TAFATPADAPLRSLPPGLLLKNTEYRERHGGDTGFDGWLRHRRELRRMIGRYRRTAVACRVDAFLVIDADVEDHRRHAGAGEFGEILAGGRWRRSPELVAECRLQHIGDGCDHIGIIDDGLGALEDLDVGRGCTRHCSSSL